MRSTSFSRPKESAETSRRGGGGGQVGPLDRRVALGAFTVIVVAELGDLTQILTANLVARYHNPLVGLRRDRPPPS
jgi:putative Ca2+/H+ antiporter (TMEM165/GDT1 family)